MDLILGTKRSYKHATPSPPPASHKRPTKFIFADATSNDFLPERERFSGQAAEIERRQRQQQYLNKQQLLQMRRESTIKDYQDRWRKEEEIYQKDQQKLVARASGWKLGMKNNLSAAYNPITLDYDQTEQGRQLKYQDDYKKYKVGQRNVYLDMRQNCGFNPINGKPRYYSNLPRRPNNN